MLNPGSSPAVEVFSSRAAQDTSSVIYYTCPACVTAQTRTKELFFLIGS
jgi:hypothetical protein